MFNSSETGPLSPVFEALCLNQNLGEFNMLRIEGDLTEQQPSTEQPAEQEPATTLPGDPDNGPQAA